MLPPFSPKSLSARCRAGGDEESTEVSRRSDDRRFLIGTPAILKGRMKLETLRQYGEANDFLIGTTVALLGIFLGFTRVQGLVWISAGIAVGFLAVYPHVRTRNRWHLYGRREQIFQVSSNVLMTGYLGVIIVLGLTSKGVADFSSNFGLLGSGLVLPLAFLFLEETLPQWARGHKECPDCYRVTLITAKACPCGHHWPREDEARNASDPA